MEVVYGGGFKDKTLRELIILERNGKLIVRRIRRKITANQKFKDKYPEANIHDYTRHRNILLNQIDSIDWLIASPNVCPMPTLIYHGKRYYYNRVSGQWWDLPMIKYWNNRTSDLWKYEDDRQFKVGLCVDPLRNYLMLSINQKIVDSPIQPCNIIVFRNNELIHNETFSFTQVNLEYQLEGGMDSINIMREIDSLDNQSTHDIYCILVNGYASFYDNRSPAGLCRSIPKFLLFGMEEYETTIGEPYKLKNLIFGQSEPWFDKAIHH